MNKVARARAILKKARMKPNKTELSLLEFLNEAFPKQFIYNGGQIIIEGLVPDFFCIDGSKALIEFIGNPNYPKHDPEYLEEREKLYIKYGFKVLYLYTKDLLDEDALADKVLILLSKRS